MTAATPMKMTVKTVTAITRALLAFFILRKFPAAFWLESLLRPEN